MISGAVAIIPNVAGIAMHIVIINPLAYSLANSDFASDVASFASFGKYTVAIASVNTPSGNSIIRLDKYSDGNAELSIHNAITFETNTFNWYTAAPSSAGTNNEYSSESAPLGRKSKEYLHPRLYDEELSYGSSQGSRNRGWTSQRR